MARYLTVRSRPAIQVTHSHSRKGRENNDSIENGRPALHVGIFAHVNKHAAWYNPYPLIPNKHMHVWHNPLSYPTKVQLHGIQWCHSNPLNSNVIMLSLPDILLRTMRKYANNLAKAPLCPQELSLSLTSSLEVDTSARVYVVRTELILFGNIALTWYLQFLIRNIKVIGLATATDKQTP